MNGDFEATAPSGSNSVPVFWTLISGSSILTQNDTFLGKQSLDLGLPGPGSIKQSFSSPVKASQFSFWAKSSIGNGITGSYNLFLSDGTAFNQTFIIPTVTFGINSGFFKIQKLFSPSVYVTAVQINNNTSGFNLIIDEVQLWEESLPVEETDQPRVFAHVFRGVHIQSEDAWTRGALVDGTGSAYTDGDVLTLYYTGSGGFVGFSPFPALSSPIDIKNIYKTLI